jgi:glycosyltransferase involved in cell wall biosynthesis
MPPKVTSKKGGKATLKSRPESSLKFKVIIPALLAAVVAFLFYGRLSGNSDALGPILGWNSTPNRQVVQGVKVSIIMVAHNENQYLQRTFDSIMGNSPLGNLHEIVFVDDASDPPASIVLNGMNNPLIKIVRNDERQGLIRAKTIGAHAATGDLFIYLDAHIRAYPGWMDSMITLTRDNYKRIVVPLIPVLDENTWEQVKDYTGVKLIFDWKMDFIWYVDHVDDNVPIMSGGLLAITRKWFFESGEYDMGMLQWGGENVEQSVRTWLCGGEIVVARDSRVGHMFRENSPYVINTTQIHVNKARAIDVWFDEWKGYYYRANPFDKDRRSSEESLAPRFAIQERLGCKPFSTFVEKFKHVFFDQDLLPQEVYSIKESASGLCLSLEPSGEIKGVTCNFSDRSQVFIPDSWKRFRNGKFVDDCLDQQSDSSVKAGLCSAHVDGQKGWTISPEGFLEKYSYQDNKLAGTPVCAYIERKTSLLRTKPCGGVSGNSEFEIVNIQPYSHQLYH